MTTIQRYRHVPVLATEPGIGTGKCRTIDRAALAKKALATVYGEYDVSQDPSYYVSVLYSDLLALGQQLALEQSSVARRGQSIRNEHAYAGQREQERMDAESGE